MGEASLAVFRDWSLRNKPAWAFPRYNMAREEFLDSLRRASRMLVPPRVRSKPGAQTNANLATKLRAADLWLTPKSVEGFDPADFADWPKNERDELKKEVAA